MLVPYITDGFYSEIIELVESFAESAGFRLIYKSSYNNAAKEAEVIKSFLALKACAMIVVPVVDNPGWRIHELAAKRIPLVYLDRVMWKGCRCVLNDNEASGEAMTSHLLSRTKRVAYLGSFYGSANPTAAARQRGYLKAVAASGATPLLIPVDSSAERQDNEAFGHANMAAALKGGAKFKAVFCVTDSVALGACKAIREFGLEPGKDMLVAGHDNLRFSAYSAPSITTMAQPKAQLAEACFEMASKLAQGKPVRKKARLFKSELIVRESA